jgi:O-acetyl-ADP-ribose deacetylase (regulator of RNase III)
MSSKGAQANNQLRSACTNSLQQASDVGTRLIVFPAISTDIFAFPINIATGIALTAVYAFIDLN